MFCSVLQVWFRALRTQLPWFTQQLNHGDCITQKPRQSNVLQICHGKHNTRLKLASLDDASAGIKYGVASPILCGAWIVADGRSMPVTTKVSISVNFKTIVTFGTHRDYLSPCSLEILNQVDYRVFM